MKIIFDKIKKYHSKIFQRVFLEIYIILSYPIFFLLALFLKILNIKMLNIVYVNAIGHYMLEPECYIRENLVQLEKKYKNIFFLAPKSEVCNSYATVLWKEYFTVFESNIICFILKPLSRQKICHYDIYEYVMNENVSVKCFKIFNDTYHIEALHKLSSKVEDMCKKKLKEINITEKDWFVVLHTRDADYRNQKEKTIRDTDIGSYQLAIKEILNRGGKVIRVGTKGTKMDLKGMNIIDYPNSDLKSEEMDFFLCANAKLAIVCTSGLAVIPAIFKTPILYTNVIPMGNSLPLQPGAVTIPKLLFSKKFNRKLTFKESLDLPLGNAITNTQYEDNEIDVIDNTAEDIRDGLLETLQRVDKSYQESEEKKLLQKKFKTYIRKDHYSYGSGGLISERFLKKNIDLLQVD